MIIRVYSKARSAENLHKMFLHVAKENVFNAKLSILFQKKRKSTFFCLF